MLFRFNVRFAPIAHLEDKVEFEEKGKSYCSFLTKPWNNKQGLAQILLYGCNFMTNTHFVEQTIKNIKNIHFYVWNSKNTQSSQHHSYGCLWLTPHTLNLLTQTIVGNSSLKKKTLSF